MEKRESEREREKPQEQKLRKGHQKRKIKKHYPNRGRRALLPWRNLNNREKATVRETCRRLGVHKELVDYFCGHQIQYVYDGDFTICLLNAENDVETLLVGATKRSPLDLDNLKDAKKTALAKALRLIAPSQGS